MGTGAATSNTLLIHKLNLCSYVQTYLRTAQECQLESSDVRKMEPGTAEATWRVTFRARKHRIVLHIVRNHFYLSLRSQYSSPPPPSQLLLLWPNLWDVKCSPLRRNRVDVIGKQRRALNLCYACKACTKHVSLSWRAKSTSFVGCSGRRKLNWNSASYRIPCQSTQRVTYHCIHQKSQAVSCWWASRGHRSGEKGVSSELGNHQLCTSMF
jgi:hypothetical protein